jgi:hypothetical protein
MKLDLTIFDNFKDLNQTFSRLLKELETFLNMEVLSSNVQIELKREEFLEDEVAQSKYDLGVKRITQNNINIIEISETYNKFLPIILLREAYYCFVPEELRNHEPIQIIINVIIEIELKDLQATEEWKSLIRENIIDYDYLTSQFDRVEHFLKLKGAGSSENPIKFFFDFIRRNVFLIRDEKEGFYDEIFKEFVFKTSKSMNNNEIIETIRVLIEIFYKVKSYGALLEYQNFFKEFKEKGIVETDLSIRKFTSNMQWISKYSYIAPSYHINWNAIDIAVIHCTLKFNPILNKEKINRFIENIPFFENSKSSDSNFAIEVSGVFVVPSDYVPDIKKFLENLYMNGYIIDKTCILYDSQENNLNLNYFREFYRKGRIINPNHKKYQKKYEIKFSFDHGTKFYKKKLSILDFLILNRVRYWAITGFTFERRSELLKMLKNDLINEILSQQSLIKDLKRNLQIFQSNINLKNDLLDFIELNKNFGFFYIKILLENLVESLNTLNRVLIDYKDITSLNQLILCINKDLPFNSIEETNQLNNTDIKKVLFSQVLPLYFNDEKDYEEKHNNYLFFNDFFRDCYNLKIFNLETMKRIIQDKSVVEKIYSTKEAKLEKSYKSSKLKNYTANDVNDILYEYLEATPPLVIPLLIQTINTTSFSPYFIILLLNDTQEVQYVINQIKHYFPRFLIASAGIDIFTRKRVLQIEIYLPNINHKEKFSLVSILYNLFNENLLKLKRYYFDGFFKAYSRTDFYDFENKVFFYTEDLFKQYLIYTRKIFGNNVRRFQEKKKFPIKEFYSEENDFKLFIKKIEDRKSREHFDFNIKHLYDLSLFHLNLNEVLCKVDELKTAKQSYFFKNYIKAIKFKIAFHYFGLDQYYLYIRPSDLELIDYKLLLINSFQKIKYPAYIDNTKSLFIKYIFPYRNPNESYINWLSKSKKIIEEYCLFRVKKIYQILHFDYNLTSEGLDIDPNRFKTYMQKILLDKSYRVTTAKIKEFDMGDLKISKIYGPKSRNFNDLTELSKWKTIDIKSVLGTRNYPLTEKILNLIRKQMIFPYIKLKNLGLIEKVFIILPNVKKELNDTIINIFNFFNICFIYEMEGHYFIKGLINERKFENGLFIELYLPNTDLQEFQQIFYNLFQFLNIKKYLILSDIVDGTNLIKNIYGNLDFKNFYNPLKNLKWSKKDQIFVNFKLFGENFKPNYPDLVKPSN